MPQLFYTVTSDNIMNHKHTEIIGPFTEPEWSYAVIDGYRVPHIKLVRGTGQNDGKTEIHLDSRLIYAFSEGDQLDLFLHLLANAMAVAAGYSCFGANSVKDPNPFHVKMMGIG